MSKINKQILTSSVNGLIKKSKVSGYLDLKEINKLYLYDYYMDFSKQHTDFNDQYILLRDAIYDLKTSLNEICNYKSIINNLSQTAINPITLNTAPILQKSIFVNLTINDNLLNNGYTIDIAEFDDNYFDAEGDTLAAILIYISEVNEGFFELNGELIGSDVQLTPSNLSNLVYFPNEDNYTINIPVRVLDINPNALYSPKYNYTINIIDNNIPTINQPATIGDITLYPENREITILTLDVFTNLLTPPYNDPEGDLIDAIRIDEIGTANLGKFYYNNIEVTEGLIISKEDIINGLFEHRGANVDDITSDVINFSVRDEGSLIWVQ